MHAKKGFFIMNKLIISVVLAAATLSAPVLSFAQSTAPLTRATVIAQLAQLEKAGYNPGGDDVNYPSDLEAAEAKVAMQDVSTSSSVGGMSLAGHSASGAPMNASCTGPASFCNLYFGN
jgi:hypothetical protein